MTEPRLSVIIPTFDRARLLERTVDALFAGDAGGLPVCEAIVFNDCSTDYTEATLRRLQGRHGERLRVFHQPNLRVAAARNRGMALAHGRLFAFLGDDIIPDPAFLATHWRRFEGDGCPDRYGAIGRTFFHPEIAATPFRAWINEWGLQFGFSLIEDPENVPFNFFYTSNLSLAREWLLEEPFDETFPDPAWEDIETAYRLFQRGLRLVYEPQARLRHDHPTDFRRFAARQERAGASAVRFARKHPELAGFLGIGHAGPAPLPPRLSRLRRECLVRALQFLPVSLPGMWEEALRVHYLRGLHRAWRAGPVEMERVGS